MKRDILKYLFILTLAVVISILIYFHFKDNNNAQKSMHIYDREEYKEIIVDDIKEIEIQRSYEAYFDPIVISDKDEIKEVFDALGNILISKETDTRIVDDEYTIIIRTDDKTISYYFEGSILNIDDKYYEVEGLYKVKSIVNE